MSSIILQTKLVGDIQGNFIIPSYQRGYRWGKREVELLILDVLENGDKPYCLQPIVVKKLNDSDGTDAQYELIDGQQRLTTLYLIYQFIHKKSNGFMPRSKWAIEYETRKESSSFLNNIDESQANDNIDFWYISNAYKTIDKTLPADETHLLTKINQYFAESVSVIWYEIPPNEDAPSLFQRLNIGKIQLTASELVKALFLRDVPEKSVANVQEEIVLQWDNMERDLHDDTLWAFLTNKKTPRYATRIDLILDLIAGKSIDDRDPLSTFFYFDDLSKRKNLYDVWKEIQASFLQIKEWRYNHELYHKIGYLIASHSNTLNELFTLSKNKKKSEFNDEIEKLIHRSIRSQKEKDTEKVDILSLNYNSNTDRIMRILLLFNVESVRTIDNEKQWFPFEYKEKNWSLEHIHAQHSEGLETNDKRLIWLKDHAQPLEALLREKGKNEEISDLISEMKELISQIEEKSKKNIGEKFKNLQERAVTCLSIDNDIMHDIGNLALLDVGNNAALSNYVFDAKRNKIIEFDKKGKYIPFCTKMVFFKYYSKNENLQIHFWGHEDMSSYVDAINSKLSKYLTGNKQDNE